MKARMHLVGANRKERPGVVPSIPGHRLCPRRPRAAQHPVVRIRGVEVQSVAADHDLVHPRHIARVGKSSAVVHEARVAAQVAYEDESGHDRRGRNGSDAERGNGRRGRGLEEKRKARPVKRDTALDVRQLPGTAKVRRHGVVVQRSRAVGVQKPPLVAVNEPAVWIHAPQVDLVPVAVTCDCIEGRIDR